MSKDKFNAESEVKKKEKREKVYNLSSSTHLACGLMFTLCILLLNFLIEKIYVVIGVNPLIFFDILFYIAFVFLTGHLSGTFDILSKVTNKVPQSSNVMNNTNSDSVFDFNFNIVENEVPEDVKEVVFWSSDDLFKVFFTIPLALTSLFFVVFLVSFGLIDNLDPMSTPLVVATKGMFFCLLLTLCKLKVVPAIMGSVTSVNNDIDDEE